MVIKDGSKNVPGVSKCFYVNTLCFEQQAKVESNNLFT